MATTSQPESDATRASSTYAGARAVLATMHGKQAAIAPVMHDTLGLQVETAEAINTDALGTFTGEIPRPGSIRETAIAKARLGMARTGLPIGLASEGSYGPHPSIPFVCGGLELMVLVDDTRGIVITEHLVVDAPVYAHAAVSNQVQLATFFEQTGFPQHAVIVKPNRTDRATLPVFKGLRSASAVADAVIRCAACSIDQLAFVQTDMRAHMNPTRMASIARLAARLCARIATACPHCAAPGYGQTDIETGLPCAWCGCPSDLVRHEIFGCVACDHREHRPRPDGLEFADPGRCSRCNP